MTIEDIKKAVEYVFKDCNSQKLESILYITDYNNCLSFRWGNFTTGLEGIKDIYKQGYVLGLTDINYNGKILEETERIEIINQIFAEK